MESDRDLRTFAELLIISSQYDSNVYFPLQIYKDKPCAFPVKELDRSTCLASQ